MKKIISTLFLVFALLFSFAQNGTGYIKLTDAEQLELDKEVATFKGAGISLLKSTLKSHADITASKFDLRTIEGLTPVKDQGKCGSCWAFSSLATIESNYALVNSKLLDLSEQSLVHCVQPALGDCKNGGHPYIVYSWLLTNKDAFLENETENPYADLSTSCNFPIVKTDIKLTDAYYFKKEQAKSRDEYINTVKSFIAEFGAISAAVCSNVPSFMNYKAGEVLRDTTSRLDHAINVVGWDDDKQAWLIRNSWGPYWGENGYAWVGYDALGINEFLAVETAGIDDNNDKIVVDKKDKVIFNLIDNLGKTQEYQEIFVKIDDNKPFRFYMNQPKKLYHNYIPITKGKHRLQIITKSIVTKNGKRAMIFGVLKGEMEFNGNSNYKLKYGELIKDNILNLELEKVTKK
ncbi:MAG: C1 family peptidase [Chitinophagales bacterium]|nr:C1 family peptidase [Chitinophagales bacterium]MCZ2393514.1 C1 family peptidase [Chitinophagales bacterium]